MPIHSGSVAAKNEVLESNALVAASGAETTGEPEVNGVHFRVKNRATLNGSILGDTDVVEATCP